MQTLTPKLIKDALEEEDGMVISAIRGKVKAVYERKEGGSGDKTWTIQNAIIEDSSGSTRIGFWNREDMTSYKNKMIVVSSKKGDKGINGLRVKTGQKGKELDASQICVVALEGANEETGEQRPQSSYAPKPSGAKIPAKARFHQLQRTMLNCIASAQVVVKRAEKDLGHLITEEHFQAIASSFFIQATRDGLVEEMDTAPIKDEEPPSEQEEDPDQLP